MYFMYFILEAMNYLLLINISGWLRYQNFAIKKNYGDSLRASTEKRLGCPKKEAMKRYSWYVWIHFWEITAKIEAPPGSASTSERKYNFLTDCLHLRKSTIIFSKKKAFSFRSKEIQRSKQKRCHSDVGWIGFLPNWRQTSRRSYIPGVKVAIDREQLKKQAI